VKILLNLSPDAIAAASPAVAADGADDDLAPHLALAIEAVGKANNPVLTATVTAHLLGEDGSEPKVGKNYS
jgi:hypothetical protein